MATTRFVTRCLLTTAKQTLATSFKRPYTTLSTPPPTLSSLFRLRPLAAVALHFRQLNPALSVSSKGFATRQSLSPLNDPNPNWSNRPPKETILLDGCDFEHWLVVMEKPEGEPTRDEIIDSYIKTLAQIVGSEEEARMKIYSVSTRHYYAFGALVSEELSYKLKELPRVRWVLPDSYLDVRNKDYGGEPFINGEAVPYDPKYHEEWVRNNARANERNRRNDRPRNFDRSRNFERRREMQMSNQNSQSPGPNMAGPPPGNFSGPNHGPNMAGPPPGNFSGPNSGPNMAGGPPGNMGPPNPGPNMAGGPPSFTPPAPNMGGGPSNNYRGMPPNRGMQPNNMGPPQNYPGSVPPNNMSSPPPNNMGGYPNNQPNFQYRNGPNNGGMPYQSGPGPNQNFPPNSAPGNPYNQNQNIPGSNMPPPPGYQQ